MKRSSSKSTLHKISKTQKYNWLPIDERLIPDIFSFGNVKGLAKIFLEIEFILVTLVVLGTMVIAIMQIFS
ncbi:hypothetical protein ACFL1A_03155 [Patescibacteria group bacterium]